MAPGSWQQEICRWQQLCQQWRPGSTQSRSKCPSPESGFYAAARNINENCFLYPVLDVLRPSHCPVNCSNFTRHAKSIEGQSTKAKCSTSSNCALSDGDGGALTGRHGRLLHCPPPRRLSGEAASSIARVQPDSLDEGLWGEGAGGAAEREAANMFGHFETKAGRQREYSGQCTQTSAVS